MSGRKYTEVQLQRERQERLDLLQSLQGLLAPDTRWLPEAGDFPPYHPAGRQLV